MCIGKINLLALAAVVVGISACQTTQNGINKSEQSAAGSEIPYAGSLTPIQNSIELRHREYRKINALNKSTISITNNGKHLGKVLLI